MEEQNNYEIKEPKKTNTSTIIFTTIFIILIGIIGYLTFTRVMERSNKQNSQNIEEKQETKVIPKDEMDKIAIPAVKKDITFKINALLKNYNNAKQSFSAYCLSFPDYLFKNLSLTDEEKSEIALQLATKEMINIPKEKVTVDAIKDEYDYIMNDYKVYRDHYDYYQKDAKEVADIYKEFFNENITHRDTYNTDHATCPFYYYDKANNVYYSSNQCGGICFTNYLIYIDTVYSNENEAYTNVYVGAIENTKAACENENCNDPEPYKLYNSIDKNNVIKTYTEEKEANSYRITDEEKEQFSKYKFTFKKDSIQNYYFEKIEKIK